MQIEHREGLWSTKLAYLVNILKQMGFGDKCIKLVFFCISTVKFSILLIKSLMGFFSSQKGPRKGDPHSPFLFIFGYGGPLSNAGKGKWATMIQGFQVGRDSSTSVIVSHLLYADDTLIFCGADVSKFISSILLSWSLNLFLVFTLKWSRA